MPSSYAGQADAGSQANDFNQLDFAMKRLLSRIRTVDLVKVIACSNAGTVTAVGTVTVQVLTNQMTGSRTPVAHGKIYNVPYLRIQGGTAAIILDPVAGDLGMCGFCSRDVSAVKAAKAAANPGSYRMFDWADGLYFGGFLNPVPTTYLQFDGAGGINMVAPTKISMTVGGHNVTVDSTGVHIDGKIFLTHQHTGVTTGGGNSGGVL